MNLSHFLGNAGGDAESALIFLLAWTAKAAALLAVAWVATFAMRRRSAALRHHVWLIGIVGSLALPFLGPTLPAWHSAVLARIEELWSPQSATVMTTNLQIVSDPMIVSSAATIHRSRFSLYELAVLLLAIWVAGTLLILLRLAVGIARMAWFARKSTTLQDESWQRTLAQLCESFGISRPVRLLECPLPAAMPGTWGIWRPQIVLPRGASDWSDERRRIVLSHELAHISRQDWPLQICAELLRGTLWPLPLCWLAANQLRQESERACDDSVLNSGIEAPEYANELLTLARTLKTPEREFAVALAIARPSNLERRFVAMLNPSIERRPLSRRSAVFAAVLGTLLMLPVAALRLPAQPSAPTSSTATPRQPEPSRPVSPNSAATSAAVTGSETTTSSRPASSPAQNGAGTIEGTVYDESGAVVMNALVTLTNTSSGAMEQLRSDNQGNFLFGSVVAGEYSVTVEASGFRKYTAAQILVTNGKTISLSAALHLGTIQQTVTVETDRSNPTNLPYIPEATGENAVPVCGSNPPQPGAPAANNSAPAIRVGGQVMAASLVNQIQPKYPAAAKASGIEGSVVLNALVGADGAIQSLCWLNGGKVNNELALSAYNAVRQWRYRPTLLNGQPMDVETTITVTFVIGGPGAPQKGASNGSEQTQTQTAARINNGEVFVPGVNGVGYPKCVHCPEPQYTPEARDAKFQGTAILRVVIRPDGNASDIQMVKDPGMGLGEKALETVKTWRFSPALAADGTPVATVTPIEVNFALLQ